MYSRYIKRIFDIVFSTFLLVCLALPMVLIFILIKSTSDGPALFWSKRVGKSNSFFNMPKFRSMKINTPIRATHEMLNADQYTTPIGSFLRKTSIDELPQLWSIWIGNMSFVGPRPALYNQNDLIALRKKYGIDCLLPGLTGWAQINGRDNLLILEKVGYELEYLKHQSFWFDIKILGITFLKVIFRVGVSH